MHEFPSLLWPLPSAPTIPSPSTGLNTVSRTALWHRCGCKPPPWSSGLSIGSFFSLSLLPPPLVSHSVGDTVIPSRASLRDPARWAAHLRLWSSGVSQNADTRAGSGPQRVIPRFLDQQEAKRDHTDGAAGTQGRWSLRWIPLAFISALWSLPEPQAHSLLGVWDVCSVCGFPSESLLHTPGIMCEGCQPGA